MKIVIVAASAGEVENAEGFGFAFLVVIREEGSGEQGREEQGDSFHGFGNTMIFEEVVQESWLGAYSRASSAWRKGEGTSSNMPLNS